MLYFKWWEAVSAVCNSSPSKQGIHNGAEWRVVSWLPGCPTSPRGLLCVQACPLCFMRGHLGHIERETAHPGTCLLAMFMDEELTLPVLGAVLISLACVLVHLSGLDLRLYSSVLKNLGVFENTAVSSAVESSSVLVPSRYSLVTPVTLPCYPSYPSMLFLLE